MAWRLLAQPWALGDKGRGANDPRTDAPINQKKGRPSIHPSDKKPVRGFDKAL